jgi:hypothetical protein
MTVESCTNVLAQLVADGSNIREAVVGVAHDLKQSSVVSMYSEIDERRDRDSLPVHKSSVRTSQSSHPWKWRCMYPSKYVSAPSIRLPSSELPNHLFRS